VTRSLPRRWIGGVVAAVQTASRALAVLAALIVFTTLLVTVVDIGLRTTIHRPIPGVFEYSEVALVALVFLGVPYTMQIGGHVAIDSLTTRLPAAWRHYVEAVALVLTLPFVVWLTVASIGVAVDSFQSGEAKYGVVQAPVWPARAAIAIGSALLAAEIAITIGRLLTGRREQPDSSSTELL
jgi:TRAP-type C4-dicarboxylate transport system permease small subunit